MKVSITVDFTEADRRNVARFHGNDGLASHIQCVAWSAQRVRASLNVLAQAKPRPAGNLPAINQVEGGQRG